MPVQNAPSLKPQKVSWPRPEGVRAGHSGVRGGLAGVVGELPRLLDGKPRAYAGRSRFVLAPLSLTLDQLLFLITAALLCMGLLMVQSADQRVRTVHDDWVARSFNNKNFVHACIAIGAMTFMWRFDYRKWLGKVDGPLSILKSPATWLVLLTIGMLVAVLVTPLGKEVNGARRWLGLGPFGFQPSELAKLSLVMFVSAYAVHCRDELRSFGASVLPILCMVAAVGLFAIKPDKLAKIERLAAFVNDPMKFRMAQGGIAAVLMAIGYLVHRKAPLKEWRWGFLPLLLLFGGAAALVLKEDFGTTVLIALVVYVLMMMAGFRWWHLGMLIPPAAGVAVLMLSTPFRRARLLAFLNPESDPQGAGFHVIQSLLTISSGGFWGRGLGNGIQKMGYLPEDNTDFIFAVVCEELGFMGALMVIGLFAAFVFVGWRISSRCSNLFGKMLAFGITAFIGLQAAINVAVVTASMPTKGIALPLISSGGTGWIMNAAAIGVLMSIERVTRREQLARTLKAESGQGFPVQVSAVPVVSATPVVAATPVGAV